MISSLVLSFFHCYNVQNVSYLVYDFSLLCYDHLWFRYLPLALIMLIIYPIGVPLAFFVLLFRSRNQLKLRETKNWLGFLYEAYYFDQWWFELVDMLHKLFLTSILRFFSVAFQLPTAMSIVILYLIILLVSRPYLRFWNDIFHILAQIYLYLILLAALLRQTSGTADNFSDIVLSIFILTLTLFLVVICLVEAILTFRNMFRKYQREQAERLAMREEVAKVDGVSEIDVASDSSLSELSPVTHTPGVEGRPESRQGLQAADDGAEGDGDGLTQVGEGEGDGLSHSQRSQYSRNRRNSDPNSVDL